MSFDDEIKLKCEQTYENCFSNNLQKIKLFQQNEVFSIYKNAPFTIYDINSIKITFKYKNLLYNNKLYLKVDICDIDILSLSSSINSIYI